MKNIENRIEKVKIYYSVYAQMGQRSSFNKFIKANLLNDFSIIKCPSIYNADYKTFMVQFFDRQYDNYILKIFGESKVINFLNNIDNTIKKYDQSNEYFAKKLKEALENANFKEEKEEKMEERIEDLSALDLDLLMDIDPIKNDSISIELKDGEISTKNKSVSAGLKLEIDVESILHEAARDYLKSDQAGILTYVAERIKLEASKLRPTQVIIDAGNPVKFEGQVHTKFKELLDILMYEKQAFLVGPAGTGKTTLASQAAKALELPFGHMSCTAGMSEAHLTGRMIADGSYISSEFVKIYENGGVFLLDEIDAADPNTLLIINSAIANGYMSIPNRRDAPKAERHKDFYAVCAANTWGNGSSQYSGRSVLDSAFLDRFAMSKLEVNYDTKLEVNILKDSSSLASKLTTIRKNIMDNRLRRILSTRTYVSAAISIANGKTHHEILDRFFVGWTPEEKSKAMRNV